MNFTKADWNNVPPVPWDLQEMVSVSPTYLSEFLMAAFNYTFAIQPVDVVYCSFPDGLYAGVLLDEPCLIGYNAWAVAVSSRLRSAGIHVCVFVRAAADYLQ